MRRRAASVADLATFSLALVTFGARAAFIGKELATPGWVFPWDNIHFLYRFSS